MTPAKPSGRGCSYGISMAVPIELPRGLGARLSGYHVVCQPCFQRRRDETASLSLLNGPPSQVFDHVPQVVLRWVYRSQPRGTDRYLGECETCGTCFLGDSEAPAHLVKRDTASSPSPEKP